MNTRATFAALVVVAALTGCGGDDDNTPPMSSTPPTTTPPAATNPDFNTFVVNAINQPASVSDSSEPTAVEGVAFTFKDEDTTAFNSVLPP